LVTGEEDAFYKMCMVLPEVVEKVVNSGEGIKVSEETVLDELKNIADKTGKKSDALAMAMAVYMLGFSTYNGFSDYLKDESSTDNDTPKRLYTYAKMINRK
jgi:hypothetical protein